MAPKGLSSHWRKKEKTDFLSFPDHVVALFAEISTHGTHKGYTEHM
jgi:hypothetical protein